jgi:Nucleotidyl transferase AbiEii toxin, Type IV TA system
MIEQVNFEHQIIDHWTFGGGSAMMLQINHRESHDVDIFLPDAQLLSFLDPQKRDFDLEVRPSDYSGDGSRFLKLSFEIGEIDFIVAHALTSSPTTQADVEGDAVLLETIPEIITKKIYHRGASIAPRDIFDIAAGSETQADLIIKELRGYRKEVATTLVAIEKQNPNFVTATISQLLVKDSYLTIAKTALEKAKEVLKAV